VQGAFSSPPDPLAGFGGRFAARGGAGLGKRRERGGRGKWREREGPQVTVEPARAPQSLATPLQPCKNVQDIYNI